MPKATGTTKKAAAKKTASSPARAIAEDNFEGDDWFAPLDDTVDFTNTLFYGREGSAKTTDACFLANRYSNLPLGKGKILVINAEGGLRKGALKKRGIDTDRIVLWPDPKKHERVNHRTLDKIHRKVKSDLANDPESWGGVVFDSATEIHTAFLDFSQAKRVNAIKMQGKDVDEEFVDIADYGTMSKLFRDVMRKFRDLPCHFVVTALERRDVDKDTGKPQYGPAVTPGIQSDLLGYVDFVIMMKAEDEDGPFRGLTRANSRYRAKDRFDILPRVMVEPRMDRILEYVDGTLDLDNDEEQSRLPARAEKAQDKAEEEEEEKEDEPTGDES